MAKRRSWTILFVPDDESGPRQFTLGPGAIRLLKVAVFVGVVLVGLGVATYWSVARIARHTRQVQAENTELLAEVQKVWDLEQLMTDMLETDYKIRTSMGYDFPEDWPGYNYQLAPPPDSAGGAGSGTAGGVAGTGGGGRASAASGDLLFAWPVTQGFPTSEFGEGSGTGTAPHTGLDIAARTGTPVRAAYDGTVLTAGFDESFGNMVEVDHGGGLITRYGHNARFVVHAGQIVRKGDVIAYVGSSGKVTTGPHLHFEVIKDGRSVDPRRYLPKL